MLKAVHQAHLGCAAGPDFKSLLLSALLIFAPSGASLRKHTCRQGGWGGVRWEGTAPPALLSLRRPLLEALHPHPQHWRYCSHPFLCCSISSSNSPAVCSVHVLPSRSCYC